MYLGQVAAVKAAVQEKKNEQPRLRLAPPPPPSANKMPLLCVLSCVVRRSLAAVAD